MNNKPDILDSFKQYARYRQMTPGQLLHRIVQEMTREMSQKKHDSCPNNLRSIRHILDESTRPIIKQPSPYS